MIGENTVEVDGIQFEFGKLESNDVEDVIGVSKEWVRNMITGEVLEGEIKEIRGRMLSSLENDEYLYYVIKNENGKAVGCCGIREPEDKMKPYKSTPDSKSVELVNLFLSKNNRGKGLGYKMMQHLFSKAKELGYKEVIWNSGPRYRNSAWDFYNKLVGKPIAVADSFYGCSIDAPVWRKNL